MTVQPSPRQVLLDLADRCEREEASRELDARIEQAIAPDKIVLFDPGSAHPVKRPVKRGPLRDFPMDGWKGETAWDAVAHEVMSQRYTTSLDAAVTLVPEGCSWDVRFRSHHDYAVDVGEDWATRHPTKHSAHVWRMAHRGLYDIRENGTAKTPALALCAAALRARAEGRLRRDRRTDAVHSQHAGEHPTPATARAPAGRVDRGQRANLGHHIRRRQAVVWTLAR